MGISGARGNGGAAALGVTGVGVMDAHAGPGEEVSLGARTVLLMGGAGGVEGCGVCNRWLQFGQFSLPPAKLTGDSSVRLQRTQV